MAYESQTYEAILQRMMERVTAQYPNLDDREGSILFNALAPAAVELAIAYTALDNILAESFPATASREYLLIACEQIGIDVEQFEAHPGTFKGVFDMEVAIGSRWNCDLYNYTILEYLGQEDGYYAYSMQCETAGISPNTFTGSLSPITEAPLGISYAELIECLIEGEDETPDDEVRETYFEYVKNTVSDGNVAQYERWCNEFDGIGHAKIFPLWNGANTVKVSILSASNGVATEKLVDKFQEHLDPNSEGMGNGVAPIGAIVTVTTASEKTIDVSATVTLKSGYTDTAHLDGVLEQYFKEISYDKLNVPYMSVGSALLNANGVDGITNLTLNGGTADIALGEEEIPVLGATNWTVSA